MEYITFNNDEFVRPLEIQVIKAVRNHDDEGLHQILSRHRWEEIIGVRNNCRDNSFGRYIFFAAAMNPPPSRKVHRRILLALIFAKAMDPCFCLPFDEETLNNHRDFMGRTLLSIILNVHDDEYEEESDISARCDIWARKYCRRWSTTRVLNLMGRFFASGADPNIPDVDGNTALHHAVLRGHSFFIDRIIEGGGDVTAINNNGDTPFLLFKRWEALTFKMDVSDHYFVSRIQTEQCLIDKEDCDTHAKNPYTLETAVHIAATTGSRILLSQNVDQFPDSIDMKNSDGDTPIILAARACSRQAECDDQIGEFRGILEDFEKMGADVFARNNKGESVLIVAAQQLQREDFVLVLIDMADFNWMEERNYHNETVLHLAARYNWLNTAKVLVRKEKELVCSTNIFGSTPTMIAAAAGHNELLNYFLELEREDETPLADVNAVDLFNETLLHYAARGGCVSCIETVIERDEDNMIDTTNASGESPLMVAAVSGEIDAIFALAKVEPSKMCISPLAKDEEPSKICELAKPFPFALHKVEPTRSSKRTFDEM